MLCGNIDKAKAERCIQGCSEGLYWYFHLKERLQYILFFAQLFAEVKTSFEVVIEHARA